MNILPGISFKKYKDSYIIENNDVNQVPVYLTLYQQGNCRKGKFSIDFNWGTVEYDSVVFKDIKVNLGDSYTINVKKDGRYILRLQDEDSEEVGVSILHYPNLVNSIVNDVSNLLCDCNCKEKNKDNCELSLSSFVKIFSLYSLSEPMYNTYMNEISKCLMCRISVEEECMIINEDIFGETESSSLVKEFIVLYYLTFYFNAINTLESPEDEEINYVNEKYKFDKISKCITKLGIDFEKCKEQISNITLTPDNYSYKVIQAQ